MKLNQILNQLKTIQHYGVDSDTSPALTKKIIFTNSFTLASIGVAFAYFPVYLYLDPKLTLILISSILYEFYILKINRQKKYTEARLHFLFMFHYIVITSCLCTGLKGGMQVGFFHTICLPLILFEYKDKINLAIGAAISLFSFIFIHLYLWTFSPLVILDAKIPEFMRFTAWPLSYGLFVVIIFYFYFQNLKSEEKLTLKNQELNELNETNHQAQLKLMQSEKIAALGEMAGGVAHEINSPLAAVANLAGQIQELLQESPRDIELIRSMNQKIEKTVGRIAKVVKGLHASSRDGSRDPLQMIAVQSLIENTAALCHERMNLAEIQLKIDPISADCQIEGRETEIAQVLINLLGNACDAITSLKLTSHKWIHIAVNNQPEQIEISITDCGPGIPEELVKKIFQPFFTTKEIGKGTGIGLSTSIEIIRRHQGDIFVDHQCKNTRFVIRIPKKQTP